MSFTAVVARMWALFLPGHIVSNRAMECPTGQWSVQLANGVCHGMVDKTNVALFVLNSTSSVLVINMYAYLCSCSTDISIFRDVSVFVFVLQLG